MRKSVIVLAATPLLAVALASCSSSSSSTTTSEPAETPMASTEASANQAKVDAYCQKVDDVVAKANELKTNPNAQTAQEISKEVTELTNQAKDLAGAVIAEPSLTSKVTECSTKLQSASAG
ncbi:MAG: hypothetical protein U0R64_02655 [Candidatus Nanopelagicales bacterium]